MADDSKSDGERTDFNALAGVYLVGDDSLRNPLRGKFKEATALEWREIEKAYKSTMMTTLIMTDFWSEEQLNTARKFAAENGRVFVIAMAVGTAMHVFIDASREYGSADMQTVSIFEEAGAGEFPVRCLKAMSEIVSGGTKTDDIEWPVFEAQFTPKERVGNEDYLELYWKLRKNIIHSLGEWLVKKVEATLLGLGGIGIGKHGAMWQSFGIDAICEDVSIPFTIPTARFLVPLDSKMVWFKSKNAKWAMRGVKTLIVGGVEASDADIDLVADPIASYTEAGDDAYELVTKSGKKVEIEFEAGQGAHYLACLMKEPTLTAQELIKSMLNISEKLCTPLIREKLRSLLFEAYDDTEPWSFTFALIKALKRWVSYYKSDIYPWEDVVHVVRSWGDRFNSKESTLHWSTIVLHERDEIAVNTNEEFFRMMLVLVGEAKTSKNQSAMEAALEYGSTKWVKMCALHKKRGTKSAGEEQMAREYMLWKAQSTAFSREYLAKDKKGRECLETLSKAMTSFIRDGGDIGAVDVLGLLWNWNDESRDSVYNRLMMKLKSILDYKTLEGAAVDWQWVKQVGLKLPIWLEDVSVVKDTLSALSDASDSKDSDEAFEAPLFSNLALMVKKEAADVGGKAIADGVSALIKASEKKTEWSDLCSYAPKPAELLLRQDLVDGGATSQISRDHLRKMVMKSTSLSDDPARSFDFNVMMHETLANARLLNPKFENVMNETLSTGAKFSCGPVKTASRIEPKAEEYASEEGDVGKDHIYWPYTACVIDLIRCSVIVDTIKKFNSKLKAIEDLCAATQKRDDGFRLSIVRCKNGFAKYKDGGLPTQYTDVKFNIAVSDIDPIHAERISIIGEVQVLFECIKDSKDKAHKLYEVERSLPMYASAKKRLSGDQRLSLQMLQSIGSASDIASIVLRYPYEISLDVEGAKAIIADEALKGKLLEDFSRALMTCSYKGKADEVAKLIGVAAATLPITDETFFRASRTGFLPQRSIAEFSIACAKQLDSGAAKFIDQILTTIDDNLCVVSKELGLLHLGNFIVWLSLLPTEWISQLSFHKCFTLTKSDRDMIQMTRFSPRMVFTNALEYATVSMDIFRSVCHILVDTLSVGVYTVDDGFVTLMAEKGPAVWSKEDKFWEIDPTIITVNQARLDLILGK